MNKDQVKGRIEEAKGKVKEGGMGRLRHRARPITAPRAGCASANAPLDGIAQQCILPGPDYLSGAFS